MEALLEEYNNNYFKKMHMKSFPHFNKPSVRASCSLIQRNMNTICCTAGGICHILGSFFVL